MKLQILLCDICLPGYWSGHSLAHVCIPVHKNMKGYQIIDALNSEVNEGAIAGSVPWEVTESEEWYNAAKEAISEIEPF